MATRKTERRLLEAIYDNRRPVMRRFRDDKARTRMAYTVSDRLMGQVRELLNSSPKECAE